MSHCIFCDIIAGRDPASVAYEDETALAIMDISPVNRGHVLVMPKQHFALMGEMDEETGAHLFKVAIRIQQAIRRSGMRCEGINLFLADGEAAFQEVGHVHLHVLPRFQGDPFKIDADWSVHPTRDELDANAALIRAALDPGQASS